MGRSLRKGRNFSVTFCDFGSTDVTATSSASGVRIQRPTRVRGLSSLGIPSAALLGRTLRVCSTSSTLHAPAPQLPSARLTSHRDLSLQAGPSPHAFFQASDSTTCSFTQVMGSRPRSPNAYPAPWWVQQPCEPRPAKRLRSQGPEGPDFDMAPILEVLTGPQAAGTFTSVVVLASGCALKVSLDDVDLVLEPEPTSVLQVSLGGHNLMLVSEAIFGSHNQHLGGQDHWPAGLEPGAFLGTLGEVVTIEQEIFCASSLEIAAQEEVCNNEENPELPPPWVNLAAGLVVGLHPVAATVSSPGQQSHILEPFLWVPTPSPERRSPGPYFSLKMRLLEPFPNSPLQPLPSSPNPSPQARPQRPPGPHPKARRRLFLD